MKKNTLIAGLTIFTLSVALFLSSNLPSTTTTLEDDANALVLFEKSSEPIHPPILLS